MKKLEIGSKPPYSVKLEDFEFLKKEELELSVITLKKSSKLSRGSYAVSILHKPTGLCFTSYKWEEQHRNKSQIFYDMNEALSILELNKVIDK